MVKEVIFLEANLLTNYIYGKREKPPPALRAATGRPIFCEKHLKIVWEG
jgi:hypothetical protein